MDTDIDSRAYEVADNRQETTPTATPSHSLSVDTMSGGDDQCCYQLAQQGSPHRNGI